MEAGGEVKVYLGCVLSGSATYISVESPHLGVQACIRRVHEASLVVRVKLARHFDLCVWETQTAGFVTEQHSGFRTRICALLCTLKTWHSESGVSDVPVALFE